MSLFTAAAVAPGSLQVAGLPHLVTGDDQRGETTARTVIGSARHVDITRGVVHFRLLRQTANGDPLTGAPRMAHAREAARRFGNELHREAINAHLHRRQMGTRYRGRIRNVALLQKHMPRMKFMAHEDKRWKQRCANLEALLVGQRRIADEQEAVFESETADWVARIEILQQRIQDADECLRLRMETGIQQLQDERVETHANATSSNAAVDESDEGAGSVRHEEGDDNDGSDARSDGAGSCSSGAASTSRERLTPLSSPESLDSALDDTRRRMSLSSLGTGSATPPSPRFERRASSVVPDQATTKAAALAALRQQQDDLRRALDEENRRWIQKQARIAQEVARVHSCRLTHLNTELDDVRAELTAVEADVRAARDTYGSAAQEGSVLGARFDERQGELDRLGRQYVKMQEAAIIQDSEAHIDSTVSRAMREEFDDALRHLTPLLAALGAGSDRLNVLVTCPVCLGTLRAPVFDCHARRFRCEACQARATDVRDQAQIQAIRCAELDNFLTRMDVLQVQISHMRQMHRNVTARIM